MKISACEAADFARLLALQPSDWPDIAPPLELYRTHPFCSTWKAEIEGEVVGTGTAIVFGKTAWIAHILVSSLLRNRGIGGSIVERLMLFLEEQAVESISLIATDLGLPLYRRFGFEEVSEYVFFLSENGLPESANLLRSEALRASDAQSLLDLDFLATGERREQLLDAYLLQTRVIRVDGELTGYWIPGLGEGPVISKDFESGQILLREKLSGPSKVALPSENWQTAAMLERSGFVRIRAAKRMSRGKRFERKPEYVFARIGGNLG